MGVLKKLSQETAVPWFFPGHCLYGSIIRKDLAGAINKTSKKYPMKAIFFFELNGKVPNF